MIRTRAEATDSRRLYSRFHAESSVIQRPAGRSSIRFIGDHDGFYFNRWQRSLRLQVPDFEDDYSDSSNDATVDAAVEEEGCTSNEDSISK